MCCGLPEDLYELVVLAKDDADLGSLVDRVVTFTADTTWSSDATRPLRMHQKRSDSPTATRPSPRGAMLT